MSGLALALSLVMTATSSEVNAGQPRQLTPFERELYVMAVDATEKARKSNERVKVLTKERDDFKRVSERLAAAKAVDPGLSPLEVVGIVGGVALVVGAACLGVGYGIGAANGS